MRRVIRGALLIMSLLGLLMTAEELNGGTLLCFAVFVVCCWRCAAAAKERGEESW